MAAAARRTALPTRGRGETIGSLTPDRGLWRISFGDRPHTVTLRENREPGAPLVWDFKGNRGRALAETIRVRKPDGRGGWEWDIAAVTRAEKIAREKHHARALELSSEDAFASAVRSEVTELEEWLRPQLRPEVPPARLRQQLDRLVQRVAALPHGKDAAIPTIEEAFAIYHDPAMGGVPRSRGSRQHHLKARKVWTAELRDPRSGESLRWNDVTLSHVEAVALRYRARGQVNSGARLVTCLTTVFHWLRKKRRMRQLENPTDGFDFEGWWEGYEPNQPRYAEDEMRKLIQIRDQVDPRFALLIMLARDRGDRKAAYIRAWRSAVNCKLQREPDPDQAPYGWIKLPLMKGGRYPLVFLTARQRSELDRAFAGHLSALEARYQRDGTDYPLFPAVQLRGAAKLRPIDPEAKRAYKPMGDQWGELKLKEAERIAGVDHVKGRGWHGFRRVVAHTLAERVGKERTADALGWKGTKMLDDTYMEEERHEAAASVRQAMEVG